MKKLILLRGIPASGKSTWIKSNNLENFVVSSDNLRMLYSGLSLNAEGKRGICQSDNDMVWKQLKEIVNYRMENDMFTIVDATHVRNEDLKIYKDMAYKHNYKIYSITFDISQEEANKLDERREEYKQVGPVVINKMYSNFKNNKNLPQFITELPKEGWLEEILKDSNIDISKYSKVVWFGDLQGTFTPLKSYFQDNPEDENTLYIFVGDYVDRGKENHLSVQFCLDNYKKPNFIFLMGNHEYHLNCWASNLEIKSKEFEDNTKPQLESNGIDKKEVSRFYRSLKEFIMIEYKGKNIFTSHCGIPKFPTKQDLVELRGVEFTYKGDYKSPVDTTFNDNTNENEYQIHGHRNCENLPINANLRSFTLEGRVEHGGELRIMELDTKTMEFKFLEYKNEGYVKTTPVVKEQTIVQKFANNKYVQEKDLGNGLYSYNFTRDAFYDRKWTSLTTKARGLFVDKASEKIVARSYDKFFNIGEFEHCNIGSLSKMKFPVNIYLKENGFLGILGYNPKTDELEFCSKSTNKGDFAGYFKNLFYRFYNSEVNNVKNFLKTNNVSMVFEVVDIDNDPHIIEYENSTVVLLGIIHNDFDFKQYPYEKAGEVAKKFKMDYKELAFTINTYEEFVDFYNQSITKNYTYKGKNIEGYVIEDSENYMVKIKCEHYNFWKKIRGYAKKIELGKTEDVKKEATGEYKDVVEFIINNNLCAQNVIEIKNLYFASLIKK